MQKLGATSRNRLVANGTQYRHLIMSRMHSCTMNALVMRRSGLYMMMHATTVRLSVNPVAARMYRYRASLIVSIWPLLFAAPPIVPSASWRATSTKVDIVVAILATRSNVFDEVFYTASTPITVDS